MAPGGGGDCGAAPRAPHKLRRFCAIAPIGRGRRPGDLLRAEGLVSALRPPTRPTTCGDFKGWFRTRDGARCDPLTVTDAYSRYLLACVIVPPPEAVGAAMEPRPASGDGSGRPLPDRRGRPVAALGGLAQGGHRAGADRAGPAAAERAARAHAPDPEGGDDPAAGGEQGAAAGALRPLPRGPGRTRRSASGRPLPSGGPRPGRAPGLEEPYDAWHAVRRVRKDGSIKCGELVFISQEASPRPTAATGAHRPRHHRPPDPHGFRAARPGRAEAKQTGNTVTYVSGPGGDPPPAPPASGRGEGEEGSAPTTSLPSGERVGVRGPLGRR